MSGKSPQDRPAGAGRTARHQDDLWPWLLALDAVADRIQGIKAGADDFLTKPVHEEELFARIATALKLKHTVDRRIGELRTLKDHFAQFVRLVTTPEASSS